MAMPSNAIAYKALESHDARFDGLIYVAVKSTGIYCRPVCPARTPKFENCTFYSSAAAAQDAGYRPCLRCRPETAPQLAAWKGTSNTVSRAMAMIAEGALDGDDQTVDRLAIRVGVGERQLRRLFLEHLGTSPLSVAQTRRVLFAKQLIHDTKLPMTEVALASGFNSLRRFNEVFQKLYHRPPTTLRRQAGRDLAASEGEVTLQIRYRPPYDWESMLAFFAARAIPGVELVERDAYHRTVELDGQVGTIRIRHLPRKNSLGVSIRFPAVQALPAIVNRVRNMFDVDANIDVINEHLSRDRAMSRLVARRAGLRVPGSWDRFELAVRAVLGQQISVAAARILAGKLALAYGTEMKATNKMHEALTHVFPSARAIATAPAFSMNMPASRVKTLQAIASAVNADASLLTSSGDLNEAVSRLRATYGIGEWTAQYIALRAMRETDAFPAADIGILRGARKAFNEPLTSKQLLQRSDQWSPWRAYAAQHLWAADLD
ncbi:AlkA N-terminal domain-containing protein [Silvibacterium acidisoli]|uniref:AlkA N-terminal domain-containing protein n=1 Tax=Acidobacteriaceae bacterium ZG23-2 TaxID=2883246 RepID=UPI00406CACAC